MYNKKNQSRHKSKTKKTKILKIMYLNQRSQCIKTTEKNMIQRDLMTMKKSNYSNRNLKEVKRV